MIRLVLLLVLLSTVVSAQKVHLRTAYDGRGRPDGNAASSSTGVSTATPRWWLDLCGVLRQETWSPARGSFSDPHVLSDARRLFYIREGELHAVEADTGGQLWTYSVGKGARLKVVPGYLTVAGHSTVHNLDAQTGEVRGDAATAFPKASRRSLSTRTCSSSSSASGLSPYELATGRERWLVRGRAGLIYDPHYTVLSASDSVVFLELSYYSLVPTPDVFAFDRATGKRLWKLGSHFSPLAVVGTKVYLREDDYPTDQNYPGRLKVTTVNLRSGELLGRRVHHLNKKVEGVHNYPNPWAYDRVLIYKGVLYAEARRLYTGKPMNVARFALGSAGLPTFVKPGADLEWLAGPCRDKLFVLERSGETHRFLVGGLEGSSLSLIPFGSTYQVGANPISRLDLIGNGLYVGYTDGRFVAVNVQTGRAFFHVQTDVKNFGQTHIVGDTLIVQAGSHLLAFALTEELRP